MSVNWENGWRKLVNWDEKRKLYTYRGYNIYPLSFKEQRDIPRHLQNDYYWGEIEIIDERIKMQEWEEQHKEEFENQPTMDESLEEFFEQFGFK